MCRAGRIQYGVMALRCLLWLLRYKCGISCFLAYATTERVRIISRIEEPAQTPGVLDVDQRVKRAVLMCVGHTNMYSSPESSVSSSCSRTKDRSVRSDLLVNRLDPHALPRLSPPRIGALPFVVGASRT